MCDAAPSVALSVGDTVTVKAQYQAKHKAVRFNLCDDNSCNMMWVHGVLPDGTLKFGAWTECNSRGWWCKPYFKETWPDGKDEFPAGELVFEVKRHASAMEVWLSGHPEHKLTVPATANYKRLKVLPFNWKYDMPVQFTNLCGDSEFRCTSGECRGVREKCDGRLDNCRDLSDEDPSMCDSAPTTSIKVGQTTVVKVQFKPTPHKAVRFNLCDDSSCNLVWIHHLLGDGAFKYSTWSDCNARGWHCKPIKEVWPNDKDKLPAGELVFEVKRTSASMEVWISGHPEHKFSVPAKPTYSRLKVLPFHWKEDMPVKFIAKSIEPECGKARPGPTELVKGGDPASIESVPWHAALYLDRAGKIEFVCGGSLVSRCFVVTAAHCLPKNEKVYVALGKYISGWDSENEEPKVLKTEAKAVHRHPYYKGAATKQGYDIAVIELNTCVDFSDKAAPICIDANDKPQASNDIKVAGWGNDSTSLSELESVLLSQLTFEECFQLMSSNTPHLAYITHDKFCARRRQGDSKSGLLRGDSGGGAIVKRHGQWHLGGVVSLRLQNGEAEEVYALTDVSQYVDWIMRLAKY
ncbi:uncharacterized protein LOC117653317 isoform X2 [Thrips palmi]|nr:uncharacterized protein LOC117653317 isoform X2 [Thrips palmi]